jgi:transketolase
MDSQTLQRLQTKAWIMRRHVVRMVGVGKTGHIGGSCSAAELVAALYFHILRLDPADPKKKDRDRFLLSKGHAALVQYAALAERGFFPLKELDHLKQAGAMLQGHPDCRKTPGVEANTGSLGQGLSLANGMALAARLNGADHKIWVVIGDGECDEGQIWEAAMFAAHRKLDNVVAILDCNRLQAMGATADRLDTSPLASRWAAFGWHVLEIDGHDMRQIVDALECARAHTGSPVLVVAATIKGRGLSFAENNFTFHNGSLTPVQYATALTEIDAAIAAIAAQA